MMIKFVNKYEPSLYIGIHQKEVRNMANEKIIFISEGSSLIIRALERNLEKNGYELVKCALDVADINSHQQESSIFLLYLSGAEDEKTDALIYLKDLCTERDKLLILIGNPADIKSVEEFIPEPIISASFERPVNVDALLERLAYLTDVNATQGRLKHILVVDDDETFLKTVKRIGCRASTA